MTYSVSVLLSYQKILLLSCNTEILNLFEDPSSLIFRPDFVRRSSAEDAANFVRLTVTDQVKKLSPVPQLLKESVTTEI